MSLKVVQASLDKAPAAVGHYSQAIQANGFLFVSGCLALLPSPHTDSKHLLTANDTNITTQTKQALSNLGAILESGGSSPSKVVKTTVFLKDMNDFVGMNEEYGKFFGEHKPARSAVQVAKLPLDALVEVECIAVIG